MEVINLEMMNIINGKKNMKKTLKKNKRNYIKPDKLSMESENKGLKKKSDFKKWSKKNDDIKRRIVKK